MPLSQQNHLRLQVMMSIHHPEAYYQRALESQGIDFTQLTHAEISTFVASLKAIEADIMIEMAENLPTTKISEEGIDAVCAK
jgi:hypothetical protein